MIKRLITVLHQVLGNKMYLRDLESIFSQIDESKLNPQEKQSLEFLTRDLKRIKDESDRNENKAKRFF